MNDTQPSGGGVVNFNLKPPHAYLAASVCLVKLFFQLGKMLKFQIIFICCADEKTLNEAANTHRDSGEKLRQRVKHDAAYEFYLPLPQVSPIVAYIK